MKTFNEEDLITWANRDKAVIGKRYYFGNCLYDIKYRIKEGIYTVLTTIDNNCYNYPFHIERTSNEVCCACILPVKEEKKYRPCESLREFYRVVMNEVPTLNMVEDDIIYDLMDSIIHIRNKSGIEFHLNINGISTDLDGTRNVLIGNTYLSFKDLFDNSEIEINGKWLPFGVIDSQMFDNTYENAKV